MCFHRSSGSVQVIRLFLHVWHRTTNSGMWEKLLLLLVFAVILWSMVVFHCFCFFKTQNLVLWDLHCIVKVPREWWLIPILNLINECCLGLLSCAPTNVGFGIWFLNSNTVYLTLTRSSCIGMWKFDVANLVKSLKSFYIQLRSSLFHIDPLLWMHDASLW